MGDDASPAAPERAGPAGADPGGAVVSPLGGAAAEIELAPRLPAAAGAADVEDSPRARAHSMPVHGMPLPSRRRSVSTPVVGTEPAHGQRRGRGRRESVVDIITRFSFARRSGVTLSDAQVAQLREQFDSVAVPQDEAEPVTLDVEEVALALERMGVDVDLGRLHECFAAVDASGSGRVDFEQFVEMNRRMSHMTVLDKARELLRQMQNPVPLDVFLIHEAGRTYPYVLDPRSSFRQGWDVVLAVLVLYSSWRIPLDVCYPEDFFSDSAQTVMTGISTFLDFFCWADIALNFRTGFIQSGSVILNPRAIALRYLTTWFLIDLVAALPFSEMAVGFADENKTLRIAKVLKLFKLLRMARLVKYLKTYFRYRLVLYVVAAVVFAVHALGAVWFWLVDEANDTWALGQSPNLVYWQHSQEVLCMLLSVDSPMPPVVTADIYAFSLITSLMGAFLKAYLVSTVLVGLSSKTSARERFRARLDSVVAEMKDLSLPSELQHRVRRYLDYQWFHQKREDGASLWHDRALSVSLRQQIALHMAHTYNLQNVRIFRGLPHDCLGAVVVRFTTQVFMPEEFICRKGEHSTEMYYITKGVVLVMSDDEADIKAEVHVGELLGDVALLTGGTRFSSLRAKTFCELNMLSKDDVFAICDEFPDFAEAIRTNAILALKEDRLKRKKVGANLASVDRRISSIEELGRRSNVPLRQSLAFAHAPPPAAGLPAAAAEEGRRRSSSTTRELSMEIAGLTGLVESLFAEVSQLRQVVCDALPPPPPPSAANPASLSPLRRHSSPSGSPASSRSGSPAMPVLEEAEEGDAGAGGGGGESEELPADEPSTIVDDFVLRRRRTMSGEMFRARGRTRSSELRRESTSVLERRSNSSEAALPPADLLAVLAESPPAPPPQLRKARSATSDSSMGLGLPTIPEASGGRSAGRGGMRARSTTMS